MKKIFNSFLLIILIQFIPTYLISQDTKVKVTPKQALQARNDQAENVKQIASPLFDPVTSGTPPKPNPFPTESINEDAVQKVFGAIGIKGEELKHIKICYFYLEFVVKLELAGKIAALGRTKNIDVVSILETTSWNGLIKKLGGWPSVQKELNTIKSIADDDWTVIRGTIQTPTWKDLVNTSFWKSITVTPELIIQSNFWQNYCKYTVAQDLDKDASVLGSIYNVETRIFMYIPNIEVAYYNDDFTSLRLSSEYFRLSMVLTDAIRNRLIQQVDDWKDFYDATTKNVDLLKTYSAAQEFKNSNFYKLAGLANQDFSKVVKMAATHDFPLKEIYGDRKPDPIAIEELTCLSMIKNIQAQLQYLLDSKHLEKTMKAFVDNVDNTPSPNIFLYEPDDHLYLEDLAMVEDKFSQKAQKGDEKVATQALNVAQNQAQEVHNPSDNEKDEKVVIQGIKSWFHKVKNKVKHTFSNVGKSAKATWKDIQKAGGDIKSLGEDTWKATRDEGLALGQVGAAIGALASLNPDKAGKLWKNAVTLQQKVAAETTKINQDVQTVVDDSVKIANDTATVGAVAIGDVVGKVDKRLGQDITGGLEAAAASLISFYALTAENIVAPYGALLVLTADAAAVAASTVTKAVVDIAKGNFSQLGSDVVDGIEAMVADVAATIWSTITFVGKYFLAQLTSAVKFIGYMIAFITDVLVDTFAFATRALGSLADVVGLGSAEKFLDHIANETEAHRATIAATITTVLLVAAVILTDGAALPLLAMTVGPQLFQIAGSFQHDQQKEKRTKEAKQFLKDYQTFVNKNEIISTNAKNTWAAELNKKYEAQITNEERELGFYQNFLNRFFEGTENQMSFYLGMNLAPQLEQDKKEYNLRYADVAALYGFSTGDGKNTGVLNLNPSQGFPLYNDGRKLFSQEIAVYPALSMQLEDDKQFSSETIRKFWFNQKETIPLDQETNEVEIRFQTIYALNMFNIGLYFGGEPVDVASIIKEKEANVDAGHLAKMLVYNKETKDSPVVLKLYEHEGQGWFKQQPNGPAFEVGTWYHMKMQLNGTNLQVKIWKEGDQEPSPQSFTVQKTPQKTIGIISSGASLQYEVITPKISVTTVSQVRQSLGRPTEKEREKQERIVMQIIEHPHVGTFKLDATNRTEILKGQYLYMTKATGLKDDKNQPMTDYVVLGKEVGQKVDDLGTNPAKEVDNKYFKDATDTKVTSLISGNVYNQQGALENFTMANVLDAFLQKHGPLSDSLTKTLKAQNSAHQKAQLGPFNFGPIKLTAASEDALKQGIYIYKATSPEKKLQDKQGNPIKDAQGNPLYDYFMMNNEGNLGVQYNDAVKTIRSLVTGFEYDRGNSQPTANTKDAPYPAGTDNYTDYFPTQIPTQLAQAINTAESFYEQPKPTQPDKGKPGVTNTSGNNISDPSGPHTTKGTDKKDPLNTDPADKSLQNRAKQASGDGIGFGG